MCRLWGLIAGVVKRKARTPAPGPPSDDTRTSLVLLLFFICTLQIIIHYYSLVYKQTNTLLNKIFIRRNHFQLLIASIFYIETAVGSSGRIYKNTVSKLINSRMSSSNSAINMDGSLKKFEIPTPVTEAALAARSGDVSKLSLLPTSDLLNVDDTGNTPLIWCADRGHQEALNLILDVILKNDPSSINKRGYLGNTALSRAARGGHLECVINLLKMPNIDPNIANDKMQYPLHFAAFKRKPEVVKALLDSKKCDSMVLDRKGRTPAEDTSDENIRKMILESRSK